MQRTQRYYYEDGLVETAVGILFFVIGLALLVAAFTLVFPEQLNQMPIMIGMLPAIILSFLGYRVNLRRFYLLGAAWLD